MIWKRTLACQMSPARFDTVSVDIRLSSDDTLFRASGQTLVFPGFIGVYMEDVDDAEEEDSAKLPPLVEGDVLPVDKLYGEQHFTQPPPRFSEASLVKALEEYGIGRPSTYATIISTLQASEYATLDKKRFMPTDVGRVVIKFLNEHFTRYVDYGFTANLEDELDEISEGKRDWIPGAGRILERLQQTHRREEGCRSSRHRNSGRSLPEVRQALVQAARQARQLHRLHRLSRVRLHAQPRRRRRRRRGTQGTGRASGNQPARAVAARTLRPLRAARRSGRGRKDQTQARFLAERNAAGTG